MNGSHGRVSIIFVRGCVVGVRVNLRHSRVPSGWRMFCSLCHEQMVHDWETDDAGVLYETFTCLDCRRTLRFPIKKEEGAGSGASPLPLAGGCEPREKG